MPPKTDPAELNPRPFPAPHLPRTAATTPPRIAILRPSLAALPSNAREREPSQLLAVERKMRELIEFEGKGELSRQAELQLESGGKRLRARLALLLCRAFDVAEHDAILWAAAVELLHNATLVHDDIEDHDLTRRGKPTLFCRFGLAHAINTGDFLLMLPYLALAQLKSPRAQELTLLLSRSTLLLARGQAEEFDLLEHSSLSRAAYNSAASAKTGALFALPAAGAALLGGQDKETQSALAQLFARLGTLFQMQDDILDLYGKTGKGKKGSDIRAGKVTALVIEQVERQPSTRGALENILRKPRHLTTDEDVAACAAVMKQSGALHALLERVCGLRREIRDDLALLNVGEVHLFCEELLNKIFAPLSELLGKELEAAE